MGSKRNLRSTSDHCVCNSPRYNIDQSEPTNTVIDQSEQANSVFDQSEPSILEDQPEKEPVDQGVLSMLEDMKKNLDTQLQKSDYRKFYSLSPFRTSGNPIFQFSLVFIQSHSTSRIYPEVD